MGRFHRRVLVAVALLLALGVGDSGLFGAGKGKAAKPPKKPAPKVQHTKPQPKPKNPKAPPKAKGGPKTPIVKKTSKGTKLVNNVRVNTVRRNVVRPVVHSYARFNERRELHFDRRWWYAAAVYARRPGVFVTGPVDFTSVELPAHITVTPPVIKPGQGLPLSPKGKALAGKLDGMDIVNHWLSGQDVDWKTGNMVGSDGPASNGGAFVAAVCARLKVPMVEPTPESFLPGNQHDWLLTEGKDKGWVAVGATEAQLLANQGWVVIAVWKSTAAAKDPSLAGQMAIVRPSDAPATLIAERGPRVIMAGLKNHHDIALNEGFPAKAGKDVLYLACKPR